MPLSMFSICSIFTWTKGFFLAKIIYFGILALKEYNRVDAKEPKPYMFWLTFGASVTWIFLLIIYWTRKRGAYLSLIGLTV